MNNEVIQETVTHLIVPRLAYLTGIKQLCYFILQKNYYGMILCRFLRH